MDCILPTHKDAASNLGRFTLTERGEQLLAAERGLVADRLSTAWGSLSAEEQSIAVPLLRHITDLVSELA